MRALFALTCAGFLGTVVYGFLTFPAQVPMHFDDGGAGDRYQPKWLATLSLLGIGVVLMVLFEVLIRTLPRRGLHSLNVPHRAYWLRSEHRAEFRAKIAADLSFFGACTMALLSGVILLAGSAIQEPTVAGLGGGALFLVLLFAGVTLGYVVFMFTARYKPRALAR